MSKRTVLYLLIITVFFVVSCDKTVIFEKNKKIENGTWDKDSPVKFNVEISDPTIPYNFYINLRNSTEYGFANIYLFIQTFYPDGKVSTDTIECFLADNEGRWLGKGSGRIIDNRILFRQAVKFPMSGTYSFEFEQAMRVDKLEGIEDFGIRIEKMELNPD